LKNIRKHVGEIALFPFLLVLIVLLLAIIFARTEVGAQYIQKETDVSLSEMTPPMEVLEHEVEEVEEVEQSEVSTSVETVEEAVVQTEPEIVTQPAAPASPAQPAVPTQPVAPVQPTVIEQPEVPPQPVVVEPVESVEEVIGASEDDNFIAFEPRTMYVSRDGARERVAPDLSSAVIVTHLAGSSVTVTGREGDWYRLINGTYMSAELVVENVQESYNDLIVLINSRQRVTYHCRGTELLTEEKCTTGHAQNSPTPTGLYWVWGKRSDFDMRGNPALHVQYFTVFNGGIGFHDAPWRDSGDFGSDAYLTRGSLGCVNMELDAAKIIYENSTIGINGTRVLVLP